MAEELSDAQLLAELEVRGSAQAFPHDPQPYASVTPVWCILGHCIIRTSVGLRVIMQRSVSSSPS